MDKYINIFENLISFKEEYKWLDFKENWFSKDEIGEYILALSNGAAMSGKEHGYLIWEVNDLSKKVVSTTINLDKDIVGELYKNYLSRNLKPSIPFETVEFNYHNLRVVMLIILASKSVVTKYKNVAYIRIGSSKEKLHKFPK